MKLNKQLPDSFILNKVGTNKDEITKLKSDLEIASTNLNELQILFNSLNDTVTYIEENLGALTSEEYTCSGSVSFYAEDYATVYQNIVFDRIFLEPPTVATKFTYNQDGQFTSSSASNITTSGCTISAHIGCTSGRSCTVQWTAIGLVRKQS